MAQYVDWTVNGLTVDQFTTVNYYETNILNASVLAEWITDDGGAPPVIESSKTLLVSLSCQLYGLQYENMVKEATIKGEIQDAFYRELDYLLDNPEPLQRTYGRASRIKGLPDQKLMLYRYYKESVAEKDIPVYAKAYDPITLELKGEETFYVTVINVWNDGTVISNILSDHENWRPPYA